MLEYQYMNNYFELIEYFPLSRELQIVIILALFIATTYFLYKGKTKLNIKSQKFSYYFGFMFAPIYEETIFRGLFFAYFLSIWGLYESVIFSSLIFGLWHYKNVFFKGNRLALKQVLYTGTFYGPIFALITYFTGTIWLAVIFHYINNLYFVLKLYKSEKKNQIF